MKRATVHLRLPTKLHKQLVAEAGQRGISLNALITLKLEGTIPVRKEA